MNSNTTEKPLSPAEAQIEHQMEAMQDTPVPADLLGKLQADLGSAIGDQAWDNDSSEPTSEQVQPASPWWHSNLMRAAAAIVMIGSAGWYITQAGIPDAPGAPRAAGTSSTEAAQMEGHQRLAARDVQPDEGALNGVVRDRLPGGPAGTPSNSSTPNQVLSAEPVLARTDSMTPERDQKVQEPEAPLLSHQAQAPLPRAPQQVRRRALGDTAESSVGEDGRSPRQKEKPAESTKTGAQSTLLDERKLRLGDPIHLEELERIPTARDPSPTPTSPPSERMIEDSVSVESGQAVVFRQQHAEPEPVYAPVFAPEPPLHEKLFDTDRADDRFTNAGDVEPDAPRPSRPARSPLRHFDAMFFRDYGISQFVNTREDAESTFGLEVDTGSYTIVRNYLNQGALPPAEAVRVEEFLNAFDYRDAAPRRGDFSITAEGALTPYLGSELAESATGGRRAWLRVGVKAREVTDELRRPTALTFLVDTSGSMNQGNRIEIVRQSLRLLVDELKRGDSVAIVAYGSQARVLLDHTSDRAAILRTIDRLRPNGSTNLQAGMASAYRTAARRLGYTDDQLGDADFPNDRVVGGKGGTNHRVLLLSDGVANVGHTDAETLLRSVAQWASRGIELTSVGVGMGNYNDELLERLADRGDGRYAYVDQLEEARRLFVENLTGTLQTVGKDARVQVTFDPNIVQNYRLVGYENRDIPDAAFRSRSTDGGEIGAGHTATALYELELAPGAGRRSELGTIALVYKPEGSSELVEQRAAVRVSSVTQRFPQASAAVRLATVAGRFAEILRVSPFVEGDLSDLFLDAQNLVAEFPGDRRVVELTDLIGKARDLMLAR